MCVIPIGTGHVVVFGYDWYRESGSTWKLILETALKELSGFSRLPAAPPQFRDRGTSSVMLAGLRWGGATSTLA